MSFNPEIKDDELYFSIIDQVVKVRPVNIIEIGSANGLGSTQAFIEGRKRANIEEDCKIYCYEIDKERYGELCENLRLVDNVMCFNGSFTDERMADAEVVEFLTKHSGMNPSQYGVEAVMSWKYDIDKKMEENSETFVPLLKHPTLALVDGSPFSGLQETKILAGRGTDVIILDDIVDIKNFDSFGYLKANGYELIGENTRLRNGYAIFRKRVDA